MVNPNVEMAKRYYAEHGYYLDDAPLPLWGEYQVKTTTETGETVVITQKGEALEMKEQIGETFKELSELPKKLFWGAVVILGLIAVIAVAT